MPDTDQMVSSDDYGAENRKPDPESQSSASGSNASSEPTRPSYEEIQRQLEATKRDYAAAQQQSYHNYQMLQQAQAQAQRMQQPSGPPEPRDDGDFLSSEEALELTNAVLDQDPNKIKGVLSKGFTKAASYGAKAAVGALNQQSQQQQVFNTRLAPSQRYLNQHWQQITNVNNPVTQRMVQLYQHMEQQRMSGQDYLDIADDRIPMGTAQINIHLLRRAHEQASREVSVQDGGQEFLNQTNQSYTEPSGGGNSSPMGGKKTNVDKLLTANEKVWAKRGGMTHQEYFDGFDRNMKEARKRRGGPINSEDLAY